MMEASFALSMPPGFGFHPTDVELISHYLKRKILGCQIELEVIPEVDIYKYEPWDLPAKSLIPTRDSKWHFFTSRDKKYPNGSRANRATAAGYWKSTGKDRNIRLNNRIIGTKKTLVFHRGRPPYGKRTEWIMHEYYLNEDQYSPDSVKDIFVLCRVTKRDGMTQEEEELICLPEMKSMNPVVSLPKKNHAKDIQDIFLGMMPKMEASSPADDVDDLDSWLAELSDPNICAVTELSDPNICTLLPQSQPVGEQKVGDDSLAINGNMFDTLCFNDSEESNILLWEDFLCSNPDPYEVNFNILLGNSDHISIGSIFDYQIGPDYLPFPGCELNPAPSALTPEERVVNTTQDTGIQIRERTRPPCEVLSQRIHLQVHKSASPATVDQTFVFVGGEEGRLVSADALQMHIVKDQVEEKPSKLEKKRSLVFFPLHESARLSCKKFLKSGRRARISRRCGDYVRKARGFMRGIRVFLRRSSVVGLNYLLLVSCMIGAAMLIAFFLVVDALRFLYASSCL